MLASGKTEPIADVRIGDKVKAVDTATGKPVVRTVTALWVNHDTDLMDVTVRNRAGVAGTIHATANHLFWDLTTHTWVEADHLRPGDQLRSDDGTTVTFTGTTIVPGAADMWDLTVDGVHDFYVTTGASTILVHNNSCSYFRGGSEGKSPSFEPNAGEFRTDPDTGLVKPTHGVSVFDNPESVVSKGYVPYEVDLSTVQKGLQIAQRGLDPAHYEIMPEFGSELRSPPPADSCAYWGVKRRASRRELRDP